MYANHPGYKVKGVEENGKKKERNATKILY
jgi:hypothetical protein